MYHRGDAGIAREDFVHTACGRIAFECGDDVAFEQPTNFRQPLGKLTYDRYGSHAAPLPIALAGSVIVLGVALVKQQLAVDLFDEIAQSHIERVSHEVIDAFLGQRPRAQSIWKQRRAQSVDDG